MPLPVAVAGAIPLGLKLIGEVVGIMGQVNAGQISDEEGQRLMRAAWEKHQGARSDLDATLDANDREALAEAARTPGPPASPTAPSSPATPPVGEGPAHG